MVVLRHKANFLSTFFKLLFVQRRYAIIIVSENHIETYWCTGGISTWRLHSRLYKFARNISSDSVYGSVAYDPVKTRLSESETEGEEPANHKDQNRTL